MVDLRILEKRGISAEGLRKIFEGRPRVRPRASNDSPLKPIPQNEKADALIERIWNRVCAGRDWNFSNYQMIYAMDLMWDTPFRQVSPTLLYSICNQNFKSTEEVTNALNALGLNPDSVLVDTSEIDKKTGKPIKAVNAPAFFAVTVPLVRAYADIRRARLMNERNRTPFMLYKPAFQTKENRVRCEILTSRVQQSAKAYDYWGAVNQALLQMFLYPSGCLMFTHEEFHFEEQLRLTEGGKEEKFCLREGLRYHTPHPARTFWDIAYPMRSFNTDNGCSYAGYWRVARYSEISENDGFYNKDCVAIGDTGWFNSSPTFWRTVYNSCVVKIPVPMSLANMSEQADREAYLSDNPYYNTDLRDASVMMCEYRERLVPKDWGLGDYEHPVWFRFVLAGDGTIIYAAPVGYVPVAVFRDNGDDKRIADASLALRLAPYQDQLSNLLTQMLISVKQNLANLTLVDTNVVDAKMLGKLINQGEAYFRALNILPFDSKNLRVLQADPRGAVVPHRFPPQDINAIMLAMKTVLDFAERVLQFSSLEIAQAASHEQTKAEVDKIHESTSNVLDYTAAALDAGIEAMGRQNYEALVNHGEDEFAVQIPSDHEMSKEQLEKLGITQDETEGPTRDKRIKVRAAKKSALLLGSFAILPPSNKRQTNWEAAQAMANFVRDLMNNQMTSMAIGPQQAIDLANQIAKLAGIELDAELRDTTKETQEKQMQDTMKQVVDAVLGIVRPEVKQGIEVIMSQIKDVTEQIRQITQVLGLNEANAQPGIQTPLPAGAGGPPGVAPATAGDVVPPAAPNPTPVVAA